MQRFNIYRLNDNGTGSWATTVYDVATAEEALAQAYEHDALDGYLCVPEGGTFVVINPEVNPNNSATGYTDGQVVFTLERPLSPTVVVKPATLAHGLF